MPDGSHPAEDAASALTELNEAQRAQALERFHLLAPYLQREVPLKRLAQEVELPLRTLHRWVSLYRKHGLRGLVRSPRSGRGRGIRLPPELCQLIEGLALQRPRPSIASVCRKVERIAAERKWPVPSYGAVEAIIKSLAPSVITMAHAGAKAYSNAFDLVHRREADHANEIWQADHTPFDIWVFNEDGEPARPWFTAIVDDYSRAVAGWRLSFLAPSSIQTALTLRQAIWRKADPRWHICGIPEIFYTDHGSDFTSHHLEQVAADLKFQPIFSMPGVPRGRGRIERFFETVNQLFLCEQPGYSPPGGPRGKPSLTMRELEERLEEFLLGNYHARIHSETGQAPQARWSAGGFLPHLPESLEQLDLLLLTVARSRVVQRDGIRFQTYRYLDPTLAGYIGETVTIRYDPRDLAEIRIFYQERFICRAICQELAGVNVGLEDIIAARQRRRREVRQQIKERNEVVDRLMDRKAGLAPPPIPLPAPPGNRCWPEPQEISPW